MRRIESRVVRLPKFLRPGDAAGDVDEINLQSYAYVHRTAIPTLDEKVIGPFSDAFTEPMLEGADLDEKGVVKARIESCAVLNGWTLESSVDRKPRPDYQTVMREVQVALGHVSDTSAEGLRQETVHKQRETGKSCIELNRLRKIFDAKKGEHTKYNNNRGGRILLPNGNPVPPDAGTSLRVYFDGRYAQHSDATAEAYHKALSLRDRLRGFQKTFKAALLKKEGVTNRIRETVKRQYVLSDGSGVRYQFIPENRKPYSKRYDSLMKTSKGKHSVATGDLALLEAHAFADCDLKHSGIVVTVRTEVFEKHKNEGITTIRRTYKGSVDERSYHVIRNDGNIYVGTEDVSNRIQHLLDEPSKPKQPTLKINFFPREPAYLEGA